MGISRITQAVLALRAVSIRAERGYPAAAMPEPSEPVAAVSAEKLTAQETVLSVMIYSTAAQGGIRCEETAWQAVVVLQELGAVCTMENCSFNGRTGRFSVRVLATFAEAVPYFVKVDQVVQPYVTQVRAEKIIELEPHFNSVNSQVAVGQTDTGWELTLTEFMPADTVLTEPSDKSFSIAVDRPGGAELFPNCYWTRITMEDTQEGLRRTRVARTWSDKVIAMG